MPPIPGRRPRALAEAAARLALVATALAVLLAGCGGKGSSPTQPTVTRPYLGLTANLAASESPSNYLNVLSAVRASGADLQYVSLQWDTFSPSPGVVDTTNLRAVVDGLEGVFGYAVYVNLATLDTNVDRRPTDVQGLAWDDPAVVARLDASVDALIAALQRPTRRPLVALALGNEVDAYLAGHPSERVAYEHLLLHEYARIHAAVPGLPVAVSTISPTDSPNAAIGDSLHAYGDLVVFTYYPFQRGTDFQHRPTSVLDGDFDAMALRAGSKRWALQEVGYSSSAMNASSPAAQADFVTRFRSRIARESRDRLLFANWFCYSDFSSTIVNQLLGYYGASSPGFAAYLGNLGLRDTLAAGKPSWSAWNTAP